MHRKLRYVVPLVVAGATTGVLASPAAAAETQLINPQLPNCIDTGGSSVIGGQTTQCATPGNIELDATPEVPEDFAYPWGYDGFFGEPFVFGGPIIGAGPGWGPRGGGGGHGGGGH